jgi:hypothetical protein
MEDLATVAGQGGPRGAARAPTAPTS